MQKLALLLIVLFIFMKVSAQERNYVTARPRADLVRKFIMSKDAPKNKSPKPVVKKAAVKISARRDG